MARAPKSLPEAPLPSITELGRMLATIARREAAIDLMPVGKGEPADEEERRARRHERRAGEILREMDDAKRSGRPKKVSALREPTFSQSEPDAEDVVAPAELRRKTADSLLFRRLDALRDVISTLPAKDLADCVVQINVAGHLIMKITCNDLEKSELDEIADSIERIMVSVVPVMAAAAGLDLVEYALDEVANLHEGRFPELAV